MSNPWSMGLYFSHSGSSPDDSTNYAKAEGSL